MVETTISIFILPWIQTIRMLERFGMLGAVHSIVKIR